LWAETLPGVEIHGRLLEKYGKSALPQQSIYEWIEILKKLMHKSQ
jgi:hypothetical protein